MPQDGLDSQQEPNEEWTSDPAQKESRPPQHQKHQKFRSLDDRVVAGVAGGLGEYFDVNPWLFRLIFVWPITWPLYLFLWWYMPVNREK